MRQKNRIFAISKSQSIRQVPTKIPEESSSLAFPLRPAASIQAVQWQRTDLGLESPSYIHSFVSIRG